MQAEFLHTSNADLRRQLEFDARQFVALLQQLGRIEWVLAEPEELFTFGAAIGYASEARQNPCGACLH